MGCGALANELVALSRDLPNVDVTCLPAALHNRPGGIPAAVRERIRNRRPAYDTVFVAYADCGTGGLLDRVIEEEGVERLPGAHCYEVFAGRAAFEKLTDDDPATFFLTDFLVRNFDRLVWRGLGLDRHPDLRDAYFGNYKRVVYLAQTESRELALLARRAADRLGLTFERRFTGLGELGTAIDALSTARPTSEPTGVGALSRVDPRSTSKSTAEQPFGDRMARPASGSGGYGPEGTGWPAFGGRFARPAIVARQGRRAAAAAGSR